MSSGNVATHPPTQSLPSFAQAFNGPSYLGPGSSTLPPILPRRNSPDGQQAQQQPRSYPHRSHISPSASAPAMGRKRSREAYGEDDHEVIPRVKEEEVDELECSPPPPPPPRARFDIPRSNEHHHSHHLHENQRHEQQQQSQQHRFPTHADTSASSTIPPTLASPISQPSAAKKRRTTVSGPPPHPHRLRTDLGYNGPYGPAGYQHHPEQSAPVSPVVAGLLISPDDPAAMEQVRSTLSVKQRQKALIEQRRGSAAGLVSVPSSTGTSSGSGNNNNNNSNNNNNNAAGGSGAGAMAMTGPGQPGSILARSNRTSPNAGGGGGGVSSRRATVSRTQNIIAPTQRPPSPMNITSTGPSIQQQQPVTIPQGPSLARRRAEKLGTAGKTKPPDIIISPREALPASSFAPSIQSAPPVQQGFAHQREGGPGAPSMLGAGGIGTMALPRLPFNLSQQRRMAASSAKVPPTPSRLTAFGGAASGPVASVSSTSNNNNATSSSSTVTATTVVTAVPPGTAGLSGPAIPPRRGSLSGSNSLASVPISSSASGRAMPYTPSTANYPSLLRAAQGAAAASSNSAAGAVSTTTSHAASSSSSLTATGAATAAALTAINESEKAAFLKPFEAFYDALNDSKQLKAWLSEQLHRATALTQSLEAQQSTFEDAVERAVDVRLVGVREEMGAMQRRMAELEEALVRGGGGRDAATREGHAHLLPLPSSLSRIPSSSSSSATARNANTAPAPHPSYTFPPQSAQQAASSASSAMAVDHHLSPPPPPAPTTAVSGRSRPPSASSSPAPPPVPYERVHARLDGPRSSPKQQSQQQQQQGASASASTSSASYSKLSPPGKQLLHRTNSNSSLRASPVNNISSSRRNSVVMAPPPPLPSSSAADELPAVTVQVSAGSGSSPAPPLSSLSQHAGNQESGGGGEAGGEEDTDMDGGGN